MPPNLIYLFQFWSYVCSYKSLIFGGIKRSIFLYTTHRLLMVIGSQRSRLLLYILWGWYTVHPSHFSFQLQPSSWTPMTEGRLFSSSFRGGGRTALKEHAWIIYGKQEYANWPAGAGNNMQAIEAACLELIASLLLRPLWQVEGQQGFSLSRTNVWLLWDSAVCLGFNLIQFEGQCEHEHVSIIIG